MPKLKTLLALLLSASFLVTQAQVDSMYTAVFRRMEALPSNNVLTRLFLHVDKSNYVHNENIWFSAYVLGTAYKMEAHHTVYVCLADPLSKKVIASDKFVMSHGLAAGYVFLPDSIPAGNYQLIAFTNTYLHEPAVTPFVQSIKLHSAATAVNSRSNSSIRSGAKPEADSSNMLKINWYPEAGNLVANVKTKVAFEAHSINGKPVGFTGDLLEDNAVIATVRASETGAGTFEFTPARGKKYSIRPRNSEVKVIEEIQPPLTEAGYSISVAQSVVQDTLRFQVFCKPQIGKVYVMVHNFKQDSYFEEVESIGSRFKVNVPVSLLPPGLVTITVFDQQGRPVAERSVFNGTQMPKMTVMVDSAVYGNRSKVKLNVKTTDASGKAIPTAFSVATVLQSRIDTLVAQDIVSFFYFNQHAKNGSPYTLDFASQKEMEMFLLTKCWTRYKWDEKAYPAPVRPFRQLGLKGNVLFRGKPLTKPVEVIVMNIRSVATVMSDEQGAFELGPEITITEPDWKLSLTVNVKNKDDYSIQFDRTDDSVLQSLPGRFASLKRLASGEILAEEMPEFSSAKRLDTVVVKGRKKFELPEDKWEMGVAVFRSKNCNDYVCQYGILNCINHRNGTQPQDGNTYYVRQGVGNSTTTVLYRACKVDEPKTVRKDIFHRIKGRYYTKEFYVNDYSTPTPEDIYSTVFWKPLQMTDENGEAELTYYTNDLKGIFSCVVQGVAVGGVMSARTSYKVGK